MDSARPNRTPVEDPVVLLVGPDEWRAQLIAPVRELTSDFRWVTTVREAIATLTKSERIDLVVGAQALEAPTGLDLLGELRDSDFEVPFVLAPLDGSETLASDALAAGVAAYLPLGAKPDEPADSTVRSRLEAAIDEGRDERRWPALESILDDPERFVAVLDTDGVVERLNRPARRHVDVSRMATVGKRFWGLPWQRDGDVRRRVQRAIGRAQEGEYAEFEATLKGDDDELEFRVRPVRDGSQDVTALLVEGRPIAERARLEAELQESEELHRVTLNNMTDTVFVTDDDGEFTYVCPNVHFIFGYTAEEIYDFGTIDELLGEDFVNRHPFDSQTVLTNAECTATDKSGDEHTLLVNVRNVSIQGGTRLYSCRDITKRKQRERALTQLHQTSRDLLYAETPHEVVDRIVADADGVLPSGMAAVYQFDRAENTLYPATVSENLQQQVGSLSEFRLDQESGVTAAFVEEETKHRKSMAEPPAEDRGLAGLADYIAVPLGDHGVLLTATADEASFTDISEEITELLAATTAAALDRIEREIELREQDEALRERNQRLSTVNQVNEIIREIDQALIDAESRAEIEEAVCDRLTTDDRFRFAWIGEKSASETSLRPRAWAGDGQGYLDKVSLVTTDGEVDPTVRAVADCEPQLVSNVADHLRSADWCRVAVSQNFHSVLAIPLVYDGVLLGSLTVYANSPDAFDEMVQTVLGELGDTIAAAINAAQRKEALNSDTVVELEYRIIDSSSAFSHLASEFGCTIDVEGMVTRGDGSALVFATVTGAPVDEVVAAANDLVDVIGTESIRTTDGGGLVGFEIRSQFVGSVLADHGASDRKIRVTPDDLQLSVAVPNTPTARSVDEAISNRFAEVDLVAQRERTRDLDPEGSRDRFEESLTDRQLEVLQVAFHSGFFDSDRDITGRDVASMLDISHTAFYDHVRRAQRKLFGAVFA